MQPSFLPPRPTGRPGSWRGLFSDVLRRPGGRRASSVLIGVLVVAGVVMLAYPAVTDLWASHRQGQLQAQFDNPAFQIAYQDHKIKIGEGLTELVIPKLGVRVLVVEGTTPSALRAGAGHYVGTPLPGQRGNVAIAGHRTTYGRPFNQLNTMAPGDIVYLITPFDQYTYQVVPPFAGHDNPWAVTPDDVAVVGQAGILGKGYWLTLTTCHPPGSAAFRLVLRLRLVHTKVLRRLPKQRTVPHHARPSARPTTSGTPR